MLWCSSFMVLESWLRERDLNPRLPGYEPGALPDLAIPRKRCGDARFSSFTVFRIRSVAGPCLTMLLTS